MGLACTEVMLIAFSNKTKIFEMYFMSKTISIRIYLSIIFLSVYISNYRDKHTQFSGFFPSQQLTSFTLWHWLPSQMNSECKPTIRIEQESKREKIDRPWQAIKRQQQPPLNRKYNHPKNAA